MIPEDLTAGIVQILSYDGIVAGTGFLVSENMIATCAHVIESADPGPDNKVTIRFPLNGEELNAIIAQERWRSPDSEDLSILQLEDNIPEDAKVLSLGSSAGVIGHKVCAFGFPDVGEIEGIWSRGEVSGKVTERGISLLQINSNEITEGFSGAPLWDESRHRVIGIIVSIAVTDSHGKLQNIAFAVPCETLISICPELKIEDICPYRGLFSFKEDDEHLFFGRSKLVLELSEQLRTNPRFLALVGSSGSGKSSLVFAGLLPRIKRNEIVGFENAQVVTFRPNDISKFDGTYESDPEESLRQALKKSGINIENANLWEGIRSSLETNPEIRLVIYADQFEILFANPNRDTQLKFIEGVYGLLKSELKISLLLTIRGDYYDLLLNSLFGEYLSEGQVNIRSMSAEELREAIRKPAEITGLEIETGLEDLIIKDLKNTKNPLPLLEFTLTQLWASKPDGLLTHDNYIKIGGASGAIGQWVNETYNGLSAEEKELSRKIFTRLVHYGDRDVPDSRRRLQLEKLAGDCDEQAVHQLIKKLADAHILVTDCGSGKGSETVEIIHDSLLIEWKQLNKWITEHRGFLTWRQRLEDKMEEWSSKDDEGNLLRGASLAEAKGWMKKYKEEFNPEEIRYINASTELEEKEWAEKERIRSRTIKGLAAFSIVILSLAILATSLWVQTEANSKESLANYLIFESSTLAKSPETSNQSIPLAIESFEINRTLIASQLIRKGISLLPSSVLTLEHNNAVRTVTFSPDGKYLSTVSSDETVYMWNARTWNISTGKNITVLNNESEFIYVAFSPDGRYIGTTENSGNNDLQTRILNASTGKEITNFTPPYTNGQVNLIFSPTGKYITQTTSTSINVWNSSTGEKINKSFMGVLPTFSPDEKYIATSYQNKTAVWDIATHNRTNNLTLDDYVKYCAFSPDGKYIAIADNKTVNVSDLYTKNKTYKLNPGKEIDNVRLSPDGKYIAVASDNTISIWDLCTGNRINDLNPGYHVDKVIFSPDGKSLVTVIKDNTVYAAILWDVSVDTGEEIAVISHRGQINDVAFSPDGKYIATASDDKTACVWSVSTVITRLKNNGKVNKIAFSPCGEYIATTSNNTARVWDVYTGEGIFNLSHDDSVNDVAFSPDGKFIATASEDKTARIWYAYTGKEIINLPHDSSVNTVRFSPDGKYIATAADYITAHIWDAYTGKENTSLSLDDKEFIVFSPDVKHIATTSKNTACVLDVYTGEMILNLSHDDPVIKVSFSPDGKLIKTVSCNGSQGGYTNRGGKFVNFEDYNFTECVWEVATRKEIINPQYAHIVNNYYADVVFSPYGNYIATTGDNTINIWDAHKGIKTHALTSTGKTSRFLFSPDEKYIAVSYNENEKIGAVDLWDTSKGDKIDVLSLYHEINDIVFSPDGKYIATVSDDNTVRLWLVKTEDLIKEYNNCFKQISLR